MVIIRLLGENWPPERKLVVTVPDNKPLSSNAAAIAKALDVESLTGWCMYLAEGARYTVPVDMAMFPKKAGLVAGDVLFARRADLATQQEDREKWSVELQRRHDIAEAEVFRIINPTEYARHMAILFPKTKGPDTACPKGHDLAHCVVETVAREGFEALIYAERKCADCGTVTPPDTPVWFCKACVWELCSACRDKVYVEPPIEVIKERVIAEPEPPPEPPPVLVEEEPEPPLAVSGTPPPEPERFEETVETVVEEPVVVVTRVEPVVVTEAAAPSWGWEPISPPVSPPRAAVTISRSLYTIPSCYSHLRGIQQRQDELYSAQERHILALEQYGRQPQRPLALQAEVATLRNEFYDAFRHRAPPVIRPVEPSFRPYAVSVAPAFCLPRTTPRALGATTGREAIAD